MEAWCDLRWPSLNDLAVDGTLNTTIHPTYDGEIISSLFPSYFECLEMNI